MIPRIKLLQKMSPEVDDASLPDAKAGMIFNTASRELVNGDKGIRVVPCEFVRTFVEWAPEGTGNKAPVNVHPASSSIMSQTKNLQQIINIIWTMVIMSKKRQNHIVLILDDNSNNVESRGILTMKSSQLKKSRQWNYMMMTATMENAGKRINPPSYAYVYQLGTQIETSNQNKYFGWTINKEGVVPSTDIFHTGESFALAFREGDVIAAPEGDEPAKLAAPEGKEHF